MASPDIDCICEGNWRLIVKESEPLLDKTFEDKKGNLFTFYGIVHGSDDYYYGMHSHEKDVKHTLLSCAVSLEGHGFKLHEQD